MGNHRMPRRCAPALCVLILLLGSSAAAQSPLLRVEEDWELVVAAPDLGTGAPQVTCLLSVGDDLGGLYAAFEINQQSLPAYAAGGLQLQVWNGHLPLVERKFPNANVLSQPDTVAWTQAMELRGGTLTVEIVRGTSSTWGTFGGEGYLKAEVATALADLSGYSPEASVRHSAIGYAANRVGSLVLKRVRLVDAAGQVFEDATPRPVYQP